LHHWAVDVDRGIACVEKRGRRQLEPMAKRINTSVIALQTAQRILAAEQHASLEWRENGKYVIIRIGELIPEGAKQTTSSRRKRLRGELDRLLLQTGWTRQDLGNRAGYRCPSGH
jgi:hypothetical protein